MLEFIEIGKTGKSHGVNGAVRLILDSDIAIAQMKVIFLRYQGDIIPYFVDFYDDIDGLVVKFHSISSPEMAKSITGLTAYVATKDVDDIMDSPIPRTDFKDFIIYNGEEKVGAIQEIQQFPQQVMAIVEIDGEEVMIPLAEGLIEDISMEDRFIRMELPEGLI